MTRMGWTHAGRCWASGLIALLLMGCVARSAPEIAYYSLLSAAQPGGQKTVLARTESRLGVGPVTLPESLKRSQIVTRTADQRYQVNERHRWAGSLEQEIALVLGESLGDLLAAEQVAYFPWSFQFQPDYRLAVDVVRFEAVPAGEALLQARWTVTDGSGQQVVAAGNETLTEPLAKADFGALVAAQSRLLETFSRRVAAAIAELAR